jgi:hypothetical protein
MHTPAAALAWELWRRHRVRLMTIVGLLLGFALLYPKLCELAGFNPDSPDAADELSRLLASTAASGPSVDRVIRLLYLLFLVGGPALAMMLSLLYVVWMFTFTDVDPSTKDPMKFPARLFTLPVSTPFLFWWLWLAGLASVVTLYASWVIFVRLPHLDLFGVFQNCFGCMTLLTLAQGIVWALAAWPITRMLLLMVVLFGYLFAPAWSLVVGPSFVLPPLFILGGVLARAGLQKMRHGQWQGGTWRLPFATIASGAELRGPRQFASPAQAQLWFEWRRFARPLCFFAAALAVVPVIIHLLARAAFGLVPLQNNTMLAFAACLIAIPIFVHFCFGIGPARTDLPFLMMRPVTNGQMMMATLKAASISTVFSWLMALAALCALPLLGDFRAVEQRMFPPAPFRLITVLALMLLTWRLIAVNLCCTWSGQKRLNGVPTLVFIATYAGVFSLVILSRDSVSWNSFMRIIPDLLACLIAVKFLLAFLAFRVSLRRRLLASSALIGYLTVWLLLAALFLIPAAILFHDQPGFLPLLMAIVLSIPLARIGSCPIALDWNRHA